jgi:hypothetical protein
MTPSPQKATLDSLCTLFLSYRRLAPKVQHSLSAVYLGIYLCENCSVLLARDYTTTFMMMGTLNTPLMLCVSNIFKNVFIVMVYSVLLII